MHFLLGTLYAPLASHGEVACGERRMSWPWPARSAVLGLAGAALGYDQYAEAAHRLLAHELHYAVRVDAPGRPLLDYHVTQTPKGHRKKDAPLRTRYDEVARARALHTVLSQREWQADAFFTVALWTTDSPGLLDDLCARLQAPVFALSLGRRAAVLGLPIHPQRVQAETLVEALNRRVPTVCEADILSVIAPADRMPTVAFDLSAPGVPPHQYVQRRRDRLLSFSGHRFALRAEGVAALPPIPRKEETDVEPV